MPGNSKEKEESDGDNGEELGDGCKEDEGPGGSYEEKELGVGFEEE